MQETFINNIDTTSLYDVFEKTGSSVAYFTDISAKVASTYTATLDGLEKSVSEALRTSESLSDDEMERYYLSLSNEIYFLGEKLELMTVYADISKLATKEVYNKAYIASSTQKDEKGKSLRTVGENQAASEEASKYEATVQAIYESAARTIKYKVDKAIYLIDALKTIIRRRSGEDYLAGRQLNVKTGV